MANRKVRVVMGKAAERQYTVEPRPVPPDRVVRLRAQEVSACGVQWIPKKSPSAP